MQKTNPLACRLATGLLRPVPGRCFPRRQATRILAVAGGGQCDGETDWRIGGRELRRTEDSRARRIGDERWAVAAARAGWRRRPEAYCISVGRPGGAVPVGQPE